MSGASTSLASSAVKPHSSNLSISRPDVLPILMTVSVSAVVGRLITHCWLSRIIWKLWLPLEIIRPTSDGAKLQNGVPTERHDVGLIC
jgi:hypothetical protein